MIESGAWIVVYRTRWRSEVFVVSEGSAGSKAEAAEIAHDFLRLRNGGPLGPGGEMDITREEDIFKVQRDGDGSLSWSTLDSED